MPPKVALPALLMVLLLAAPRAFAQSGKLEETTAAALAAFPTPRAGSDAAGPPEPTPTPLPARSTVFAARDDAAVDSRYVVNPGRVRAMVDRLVAAVAGQPGSDPAHVWRSLGVGPEDVVGIKIAAAGGAAAPARRAVVSAVVASLLAAGHPRERIVVWDRDADDLRAAGFLGPRAGEAGGAFDACPVADIAPRDGYDPKAVYNGPVLGKLIWGDLLFRGLSPRSLSESSPAKPAANADAPEEPSAAPGGEKARAKKPNPGPAAPAENLSGQSHWCMLLTKRVTKIVNLPTMSDSVFCGVAGALYNVTIPNLDNWRRFTGEPRFGDPFIAELFTEPPLRGKVVLNLCDGLVAQFAGGPVFQPLYAHRQATLYASRDPVALDANTLRQLQTLRAGRGLPDLAKPAAHIHTAAEAGLGHDAAERIDLRNLPP